MDDKSQEQPSGEPLSQDSADTNEIVDFKTSLILVNCGLASGLVQAAVFNPWDRALYLSIKDNVPFLRRSNFVAPFTGVFQTLLQRGVAAGLYFPFEEIFMKIFEKKFGKSQTNRIWLTFLAGNLAGVVNGILVNPIAAVKVTFLFFISIP